MKTPSLLSLALLPSSTVAFKSAFRGTLTAHHGNVCGPVDASLGQAMLSYDNALANRYIATASSQCVNNQVLTVDVTAGEAQDCFTPYAGSGTLDCCCAAEANEEVTRTIAFDTDFSEASCPVSSVLIEVDYEPCADMQCCDSCGCTGDPHCTSFVNNEVTPGKPIARTFEVCDTRNIPSKSNSYQCGQSKKASQTNKNRCLAAGDEADDYYFNAGRCQWLPDVIDDWSWKMYGNPCQPLPTWNTEMVLYEDKQVSIRSVLGERGVLTEMIYQNLDDSNSNAVLSLNATEDCFKWKNKNGATVSASTSSQSMTVDGVQFSYTVVASSSDSADISATSETPSDTWWTIVGSDTTVVLICYGATSNGVSTQNPINTRFDATVYQQTTVSSEDGFCANGNFTDQCSVYFKDCVDPFEACDGAEPTSLSDDDVAFLQSSPECSALLEENNCASYHTTGGNNNNNNDADDEEDNFYQVIGSCLVKHCQSFFKGNGNGQYQPPPGTTVTNCVEDFTDFGHAFANRKYGQTFKKTSSSSCENKVTVHYKPEGSSSFEAIGSLEIDGTIAQTTTIQVNTSTTVSGYWKPPSEIKVVQESCPSMCSSTGSVAAKIKYVTQCEELLYYATNHYNIDSPDGAVVDTKKFGKAVE